MKKRRHSPNKRRQRIAENGLKMLGVVFVSGNDYSKLFDINTHQQIRNYPEIERALHDLRFTWSCYLAVFCVDQFGAKYMKSEVVIAPRCRRDEIIDTFVERHTDLIGGCNEKHVVGYGWIASVTGKDLDEKKAAEIFERYGAWTNEPIVLENCA